MAIEGGIFIYDYAREGFLSKVADWANDTIVAYGVDSTYVPAQATNKWKSEIPAGAIVTAVATLTGKSELLGVAKAADLTFASTTAGKTINAIVIIDTTIDGAEDRLIAYIGKDYLGAPISIPTDGGAVGIRFGGGTTKLFRL